MNFTDLRLKIIRAFRKYKKVVLIVLIIWAIIFTANMVLKNMPKNQSPTTTYSPNTTTMTEKEVPKKYQQTIADTISRFVDSCNNKDYQTAYNMLSADCKTEVYPTLDSFKSWVDSQFANKVSYSIQSYTIIGKQYIYDVNFLPGDPMATGLTGQDYGYIQNKFTFTEEKGELKLSISDFIRKQDINVFPEDENMKVIVNKKDVYYDHEVYKGTIQNKTDKYIILAIPGDSGAISLNLNLEDRQEKNAGSTYNLILSPKSTIEFSFVFNKYADDGVAPLALSFNNIRIVSTYTNNGGKISYNQNDLARQAYSFKVNFNVN